MHHRALCAMFAAEEDKKIEFKLNEAGERKGLYDSNIIFYVSGFVMERASIIQPYSGDHIVRAPNSHSLNNIECEYKFYDLFSIHSTHTHAQYMRRIYAQLRYQNQIKTQIHYSLHRFIFVCELRVSYVECQNSTLPYRR